MPFPTALTTDNYNALRAPGGVRRYKASEYLCVCSNTVVMAAQVNQPTINGSFATITFDTVSSGAYTAIDEGMTVLVSTTSDPRDAYFTGRARKNQAGSVSTSTVLNIDETSSVIPDGDYLFVLRDYRMYHKLGRVSSGVYYKDYALTFTQLKPIIYNLQSAYAGVVSGSPAGFTVSFAPLALAVTSGATISSYAWTLPSGTTVTAGATNAANVTVRFDASATEYWIKLVVTDSGGRVQTRHIPVWAVPANFSTTVVRGFTGLHLDGSLDGGWSATVDAFSGVETMLDNTLCCAFDVEYYQDIAYSIGSTVKFVGRFRKEGNHNTSDPLYSRKSGVSFEIEGTAAQLARIAAPQVTARDASSPTVWDEIKTLTIWRAIAYLLEHSNFHELFSLSFSNTANTYRAFELQFKTGSQLDSVKDIASAINGLFEFAPTGEARVVHDVNYGVGTASLIAELDAQDWVNISDLEVDPVDTVGIVEASGGLYNPTGGGITPAAVQELLAIAPGVAQGNGTDTAPLTGQILTADTLRKYAQSELNSRAGNHYAFKNGSDTIAFDLRGAYNWLIPSAYAYYTWDITADDNVRGRVYDSDDLWYLKTITIDHDNTRGNKAVSATFQKVTSGDDAGVAGQTINVPPPNTTPVVQPSTPPIVVNPNLPIPPDVYLPADPTLPQQPVIVLPAGTIPSNGAAVVIWSADAIWATQNFIGTPPWAEITPDGLLGTIRDFALVGQGGYLLKSDTVDSSADNADNVFANVDVAWSSNDTVEGEFTQIRSTSTESSIYIEGFTNTSAGCADDWYSDVGTETARTADSITVDAVLALGSYRAHVTVVGGFADNPPADSKCRRINITGVSGGGPGWMPCGGIYPADFLDGLFINQCVWHLEYVGGTEPFTATFTFSADDECGDCVAHDDAVTAFSSDAGATFATPVSLGTVGGGLDTVKIGTTTLASVDGIVRKATSGGAWSDYGDPLPSGFNPICLIIPRQKPGTTNTTNAVANPDYIVFSDVEDDDGETAYIVSSVGTTFTPITPEVSGDKGLAVGPNCAAMPWWSGNRLVAVLQFGSLNRLVTSTNGGSSWTDRGVLDAGVGYIAFRKGDHTMNQLFLTSGGVPYYSPDYGASLVAKVYPESPSDDPLIGIAVVG